jgi:glyoxylate reductase
MKRVLVTRKFPGQPEELLKKNGLRVYLYPKDEPMPREEFLKQGKKADAILSMLTDKVDKEAIDAFVRCSIIANCAVGYNNIDLEYAKLKGLIVTNTPGVLTNATADIAVALVLACARRFHEAENMMRGNRFTGWKPDMLLGLDLKGKVVGIIGAGRIGYATAKRLKSFGTNIVYFSRNHSNDFENEFDAKRVSLNLLLKIADIISVHLPLSEKTFHLLNKKNLSLMKGNAILINTSRGEIIEEKSLIEILKKEKIFAAGFDVYENEPIVNLELLKLKNTFLLPHIGSATIETRSAMAILAADNIINVLGGKKPLTPL